MGGGGLCSCCALNVKLITFASIGAIFGLIGLIFIFLWPGLFDSIMFNQLILAPDSMSYNLWKEFPIPIYISFYMFNLSNAEVWAQNPSIKPSLEQMGPYVFREHRIKTNISWNSANSSISYYQNRTWIFEPELSNGNLTDVVTTINVPAITAAYSCRNAPFLTKFLLNEFLQLKKTSLTVTKPVSALLFDGYDDPIIDFFEKIPPILLPTPLPFDKFGWFYARNGSATYDGYFSMGTGADNINNLGVLQEWNFANRTNYYPSYCGQVNGSAGEIFTPKLTKESKLELYTTDLCRTLGLTFKEEMKYHDIGGFRFEAEKDMFSNASTNGDNWCFCGQEGHGKEICHPNGVLNVSLCKWGSPLFVSQPHFLDADPIYASSIIGMTPDPSLHQTYIDLEPTSGLPLQVSASLQLNLYLSRLPDFRLTKNLPIQPLFLPAFWFKQSVAIDTAMSDQIKTFLRYDTTGGVLSWVFVGLGLSVVVVVGIVWWSKVYKKDEDESALYLVNDQDHDHHDGATTSNNTNHQSNGHGHEPNTAPLIT